MTVDQGLAIVPAPEAGDPDEVLSAAWWQQRTAEELRDIIKRGFAGGDAFSGAVAEAERRARDATNRLREQAIAEEARKARLKRIIRAVLAMAAFVLAAYLFF